MPVGCFFGIGSTVEAELDTVSRQSEAMCPYTDRQGAVMEPRKSS